jgi:hypothetical protein
MFNGPGAIASSGVTCQNQTNLWLYALCHMLWRTMGSVLLLHDDSGQ